MTLLRTYLVLIFTLSFVFCPRDAAALEPPLSEDEERAASEAEATAIRKSDERWLFSIEPMFQAPLDAPQSTLFGPGASLSLGVRRSLAPSLLIGLTFRGGFLLNGPEPLDASVVDPGIGLLFSLDATFRLRIGNRKDDPRRAVGFWLEPTFGVAVTGTTVRPTFSLGAGYAFETGAVAVGPAVRYQHVFHFGDALNDADAHLILIGLEVTFLDHRTVRPKQGEVHKRFDPSADTDGDGIDDIQDGCPQRPEDVDGFEDSDGCPDDDNDQDGVPDGQDNCPMDPEDKDGVADDDGCPESDFDGDHLLDYDDACPSEPEVVNGVDDGDGCPDEGLVAMVDDRLVLEATKLFTFQRATFVAGAERYLDLVAKIIVEHPQWTGLRIEGHADATSDEALDRRVAGRRMNAFKDALVARGVKVKLDTFNFGSSKPHPAHQNSRVELVVVARDAQQPTPPTPSSGADMVFEESP